MERLKAAKDNKEARMNFVSYWADFVRNNPDQEWGRQQKVLIDSMIQSAKHSSLTPQRYLKIKRKKAGRKC